MKFKGLPKPNEANHAEKIQNIKGVVHPPSQIHYSWHDCKPKLMAT